LCNAFLGNTLSYVADSIWRVDGNSSGPIYT
jgi:hypothetical protein